MYQRIAWWGIRRIYADGSAAGTGWTVTFASE
jgi:hypothetical protein